MSLFEKINVKVVINATGLPNTYKIVQSDGTVTYGGLFFDLYKKIKDNLKDKYNFQETFITDDFTTTEALNDVRDGKYDLGINNFTTTTKRLNDVNFTRTIIMERDVIVYKRDRLSTLNILWRLITDVLLIPLILFIVIGFVLGTLVYYLQPNRKPAGLSKNKYFKRTILATIATFLAEAGMLAEESPLGWVSMMLTFSIMAIAVAFNNFITATATNRVLELSTENKYTIENLKEMKLLSLKGQNISGNFRRYGAEVVEFKGGAKKMMEEYIENPDKYDGVALESSVGQVAVKKYGLTMTETNFGYGDAVFAVNKNRPELLLDMNKEIKKLQESLETEKVCRKYMSEADSHLCVL